MSTAVPKEKKYTYADYLTLPDDEYWEFIDGISHNMTLTPSARHQAILWELAGRIHSYLVDKPCRGFTARFDVLLPEDDDTRDGVPNVVQPDLLVVCDPNKIKEYGCLGAPDLVIEIVSPSTARKDRILKVALYQRHGVREYWIVDPVYNMVTVRLLEDDARYGLPKEYAGNDPLASSVLPGLTIDLEGIFGNG